MMGSAEAGPGRGALAGAMISGMVGVVWAEWAASGVSGAASGAIRAAGIVVGLGIVFWSTRLWRLAPRANSSSLNAPPRVGSRSRLFSPLYLLILAVEVAAIAGAASSSRRPGTASTSSLGSPPRSESISLCLAECSGPGSIGWARR